MIRGRCIDTAISIPTYRHALSTHLFEGTRIEEATSIHLLNSYSLLKSVSNIISL